MTKLPCEIVQDILPLYVDGLTSEASNHDIEEHLSECASCAALLETMKKEETGAISASEADKERKQIDFLKKTRSRNRTFILASLLAVIVIFVVGISVKKYLIGNRAEPGMVKYEIELKGNKEVYVKAIPLGSGNAISELKLTEDDGILNITSRVVSASLLYLDDRSTVYTLEGPINYIVTDHETLVWKDGEMISERTMDIVSTAHDYVGDMSSNNMTADAVRLRQKIGDYTNELQTESEPYGWTILFKEPLDEKDLKYYRTQMRNSAYEMIAVIGNLDHVTFRYSVGTEEMEETYTAEEATAAFGEDIKVGRDPAGFQRLERFLSVQ